MAITYTPTTNFGAKDSLPTNDPDKVIKGSEFTTEFTAIQTAFSLAATAASPTFTGTATLPSVDINGGTIDGTSIGASSKSSGAFTSLEVSATSPSLLFTETDVTDKNTKFLNSAGNFFIQEISNDGLTSVNRIKLDHTTGNMTFYDDTSAGTVLFLDAVNNRAGINTINPASTLDVNGTVTADGLTVDTNTLHVDATNNRVGIGTTTPAAPLDVAGEALIQGRLQVTASAPELLFSVPSGGLDSRIHNDGSGNFIFGTGTNSTTPTERMRIDSSGNVGIGTASITNSAGFKRLAINDTSGGILEQQVGGTATGRLITSAASVSLDAITSIPLTFKTAATERMRIDASGNLLVGRTSAFSSSRVEIQSAGSGGTGASECLTLNNTGADGNMLKLYDAGNLVGSIGNRSTALFIDCAASTGAGLDLTQLAVLPRKDGALNNGDISLGESSYRFKDLYLSGGLPGTASGSLVINENGVDSDFRVESDTQTHMLFVDAGNNRVGIGASSPGYRLTVQESSASGGSADVLHLYNGAGSTSTVGMVFSTGANNITSRISNFTTNTNAADLIFEINDGSGLDEAMRIDSSGNLKVGTTNITTDPGVQLLAAGGVYSHIAGTGGADSMRFYRNSVEVGSITTTGTTTTYNTSSDARLKENIADAESASELIDAIQVRQFDWKADGSHQDYGMIAQELMTVAPEAVSGDPESDDMMGVDYSKLVPMLVKEIQSLRARVAQLEGV